MRIGSDLGITGLGGLEGFQKLKECGIDYVNMGIGDHPTMTDEEYEAHILRQKEYADASGTTIWQVHGPWRWPPHDETEEIRAERFALMQNSIRWTAMIGVKYWVIHPLYPFGDNDEFDTEQFWKINYDFFKALLPTAKENGVIICFENMPMKKLSLSTPEQILKFIHMIDDENFKFCLDTGHAAVFGLSPADAVRMAGKDLAVLHVHDNDGRGDRHLLPLKGVIDWKAFGDALVECGYDGVYMLETGYNDFLPNASRETRLKCLCAILEEIVPK